MASPFAILPPGIPGPPPAPFALHIPEPSLTQLTALVQHGVIATPSYYTTHNFTDGPDFLFGASHSWLSSAQSYWSQNFNWRGHESYWNTIPQYTINVTTTVDTFSLHFAALFSQNKDAVPVIFSHGWPSSWIDFIPMLELLKTKYTPETLPYHVVVPSIPDYGLSSRENVTEKEIGFLDAAEALNELMKALGFGLENGGGGYIAQGGDVGSGITAALGGNFEDCQAVHFNNLLLTPSEKAAVADLPLTEAENVSVTTGEEFLYGASGYMLEQGTKPGTISLVLESNPLAMLAWIGSIYAEGFAYTLDHILQQVSWYWLTKSYGRGLWAYRGAWAAILRDDPRKLPSPLKITNKPLGYSFYPQEVIGAAKSWLEHWFPENLVLFRAHEQGGHFAAVDDPEGFLKDIEDFVAIVKEKIKF
ncbi:Alpha/Beta hydrolase protein [Lasiosphaeris hirsuta]|uniref:Alpha/Beta hydrolase protein n=1 Tax=Lasiosphaeris hirsuta TaxID=260670 RepID=A0AA40E012_9PEZI|nr:Alpha/Beta hydrolase protein [Lasiosphaeris hirsuta]